MSSLSHNHHIWVLSQQKPVEKQKLNFNYSPQMVTVSASANITFISDLTKLLT